MVLIGADGCKAGWFFCVRDGSNYGFGVATTAAALLSAYQPDLCLIDIPIGLPQCGPQERLCDMAARRLLGRRASSVFPSQCRHATALPDYAAARAASQAITGRGLSRQSFAIAGKIAELDRLLRQDAVARKAVREVHPEVLFWGLAGDKPMQHNKKTNQGSEERLELLAQHVPTAELASGALNARGRREVASDDVLGALAALVVATKTPSLSTLPAEPEHDAKGLPMELVYWMASPAEIGLTLT